ncbi:non-ribosomal peptide synthetase [Robbsia andropogonis]|uniref:non-ribosomal peptide synthetase n=1 Tax=Robbsia andropogonis TaxID=28092 RepID=UPI0020A0D299|nr:non-ribosomal peptide synthetase [Robbsia andropogonis]MCP1121469.1 amino acid adenylation domain-containing protein [Robbsia andropogonis]MCP1131082.1 amino acid adenylation domain-containing protein [Robbsia andropogonis]
MNSFASASGEGALSRLTKRSSSKKYWMDEFDAGWTRAELPSDTHAEGEKTLREITRNFGYDFYTRLIDRLGVDNYSIEDFWNAVTALALSRLTSQERLVLAYAERNAASPHPLILDIASLKRFSDVLAYVKSRAEQAGEYAQTNGWSDYEKMWQERGNAGSPAAICLRHGKTDDVYCKQAFDEFDALVNIDVSIDALKLTFYYNGALMDARTAHSFVTVLEHLAGICLENFGVLQSEFSLATPEQLNVLESINATERPFDHESRIEDFLINAAASHPDRVAIRSAGGHLTYGQFHAKAQAVSAALRTKGVGRGDVVAIMTERSADMTAGIFGILMAGAAYLPVDPNYPVARIQYMLDDSGAKIALLGGAQLAALVPTSVLGILLSDAIASHTMADPAASQTGGVSTDAAYLIYTSGSTGNPKGVVVEHRSVVNRLQWMQSRYALNAEDVLIQKTSVSFDVSVWELFWWTFAGASLCIPKPGAERDPVALIEAINHHKVSVIHFVPPMLSAFLGFVSDQQHLIASLRLVFASGEALTPKHVESFKALGGAHSRPRLINLYGPTEATVDVTYFDCDEFSQNRASVPLGKPIDNTKIFVLDQFLRPVPIGFFGEIFIAGAGVARGYHRRPELTAQRFLKIDHLHDGRLYRTGDIGRFGVDGLIEYAGRTDHQVKLRGFRIELQEVSTVIELLPGVRNCVVLTGSAASQRDTLLAFVTTRDESVTAEQLSANAASRLPAHMVPSQFILLAAFPALPNGKIDRKCLLQTAEASTASSLVAAPPRDDVEARLVAIWNAVLGRHDIGITDNFFAIGGNSIHFVSILGKSRQSGLSFSFQDMFQYPTIAELRARVSVSDVLQDDQELQPARRFSLLGANDSARCESEFSDCEDAYPMTALQEGLVFEKELYIAAAQYHDVFTYTIEGSIDAPIFKAAAQRLVDLNQIFRTSYHMSGFEQSVQVVHRNVAAQVFVDDLRHLSNDEQKTWLNEWLEKERAHLFQWEQPGLVRFHVQILTDNKYLYTLSQHNSALDGWSISLVHTELFNTYFDLLAGKNQEKEVKKNYIRDYVELETLAIEDRSQHQYWDMVLNSASHTLLPVAQRPGIGERFTVKYHPVEISEALSNALIGVAEGMKVPVKSVLLAAHMKVLSILGNTNDVLTGYEHSGRPEVDGAAEGIGLFLNTVPFRVQLADESYAQLIKSVYANEGEMLPNRRLPMARMKERSGIKEVMFESVFNYTHFYRLKELKRHQNFSLIEVEARGETEFALRAEFSRHFFGDNVKLNLHYHTESFDADFIRTVAQLYTRVLTEIVHSTEHKHHAINLFDKDGLATVIERGRQVGQDVLDVGAEESLVTVNAAGYLQPIGTYGELAKLSGSAVEAMITSGQGRLPDHGVLRTGVLGRISFQSNRFLIDEKALAVGELQEFHATFSEEPLSPDLLLLEDQIAQNWSKLFQIPRESISLDSNFFDLGGTSILAMKSVLELRGVVSLVQLLTNSTLGPLVRSLSVKKDDAHLLHLLRKGADNEVALVCFPYAGGNAINFRGVANELGEAWPQLSVFGVELPGHDFQADSVGNLALLDRISDRLVEELRGVPARRLIFWSHCVGAALCLDTLQKIKQDGRVERVFIGAKILHGAEADAQLASGMEHRNDDDIISLLDRLSDGQDFAGIASDSRGAIAAAFRHDAIEANRFLSQIQSAPRDALPVPLVNVIAKDDQLTSGYESHHGRWGMFSGSLVLETLESGGHFFCRTRAGEVAALIVKHSQVTYDGR